MYQNGLLECLRYSLPPNVLAYCGSNKTGELMEYRKLHLVDCGLKENLCQFRTLYAYLSFIAYENDIQDPFDRLVVKAYWIGNKLLRQFDLGHFYYHLRDTLGLKKRLGRSELKMLFGKLPQGALPNHAFHVLNVPWRTGHLPIEHTLETMDSCRISWGKVVGQEGEDLVVETQPLKYRDYTLQLGKFVEKKIARKIRDVHLLVDEETSGDWVSFHWGVVCNKITSTEMQSLQNYTQLAINLANEDIRSREHFG